MVELTMLIFISLTAVTPLNIDHIGDYKKTHYGYGDCSFMATNYMKKVRKHYPRAIGNITCRKVIK